MAARETKCTAPGPWVPAPVPRLRCRRLGARPGRFSAGAPDGCLRARARMGEGFAADWEAGHAAAAIPVDPDAASVYLAGYGVRRATAVRDPLGIEALALRWRGCAVVVVTLDLIGLFREQAAAVAAAAREEIGPGAPPVVVTCTHTHAGPDTLGLWGPDARTSGVDPAFLAATVRAGGRAAAEAWSRRRPATLRVAEDVVDGVARNARDPGVLDPVLTVLDWEPVARVVHFACHPEVLGGQDTRISRDLAGFRRGGEICWQGALGGMVTPVASGERALQNLRDRLRDAVDRLAARLRPAEGGLALIREDVSLPVDNAAFAEVGARAVPARLVVEGSVRSSAGLLVTGPYLWHLAPGEVLPALARTWASESQAAVPHLRPRVLGLADDEVGYVVPAEDFDPARYEERTSLGPRTAEALSQAYRSLRARLGGGRGAPRMP